MFIIHTLLHTLTLTLEMHRDLISKLEFIDSSNDFSASQVCVIGTCTNSFPFLFFLGDFTGIENIEAKYCN